MNRHQLTACISEEAQKALKTYDISRTYPRELTDPLARGIIAAVREGLTITTIRELDLLPVQSVVREILIMPSGHDMGYVWERWNGFTPVWMKMGLPPERSFPSGCVRLPARLLYHPAWETK